MDDLTHQDGSRFSLEEQIEATRNQFKQIASDFQIMGRSPEQIKKVLISAAQDLLEKK